MRGVSRRARALLRASRRVLVSIALLTACRSGDRTHRGPSPDEIAAGWERALGAASTPPSPERRPLAHREVVAHIDAARQRLASAGAPAGAWRWDEVRRVTLEHGLYEAVPDDALAAVSGIAYDLATDQIVADPGRLLWYTTPQLAHILVHEATHAVYHAQAQRASGMTAAELSTLLSSCREPALAYRIAAEVVAYTNQAAWVASQPDADTLLGMAPVSEQLIRAARALNGAGSEQRAFVAIVRANAERLEPPQSRSAVCAPGPVVLRGPKRGAPLDPWEAAAEFSWARAWLDGSRRGAGAP
jgi:hypothetical protein